MKDLDIEKVDVSSSELKLALQLIDQISEETYDPTLFADEEKKRVLTAIDEKIAGRQIVASERHEEATGSNVIDLMEALRASLSGKPAKAKAGAKPAATSSEPEPTNVTPIAKAAPEKERKPIRRAAKAEEAAAPVRARARK